MSKNEYRIKLKKTSNSFGTFWYVQKYDNKRKEWFTSQMDYCLTRRGALRQAYKYVNKVQNYQCHEEIIDIK
jgi:hypothetical protein